MDRTSTSPGLMYATPRLLAMFTSPPHNLKGCRAGSRYGVILVTRTAADADDRLVPCRPPQWNPTSENHDLSIIGGVDSKELSAPTCAITFTPSSATAMSIS